MKRMGKGNQKNMRKDFVAPQLKSNDLWNLKAKTGGVFWTSNAGSGSGAGLPGNPTFFGGGNGGS